MALAQIWDETEKIRHHTFSNELRVRPKRYIITVGSDAFVIPKVVFQPDVIDKEAREFMMLHSNQS